MSFQQQPQQQPEKVVEMNVLNQSQPQPQQPFVLQPTALPLNQPQQPVQFGFLPQQYAPQQFAVQQPYFQPQPPLVYLQKSPAELETEALLADTNQQQQQTAPVESAPYEFEAASEADVPDEVSNRKSKLPCCTRCAWPLWFLLILGLTFMSLYSVAMSDAVPFYSVSFVPLSEDFQLNIYFNYPGLQYEECIPEWADEYPSEKYPTDVPLTYSYNDDSYVVENPDFDDDNDEDSDDKKYPTEPENQDQDEHQDEDHDENETDSDTEVMPPPPRFERDFGSDSEWEEEDDGDKKHHGRGKHGRHGKHHGHDDDDHDDDDDVMDAYDKMFTKCRIKEVSWDKLQNGESGGTEGFITYVSVSFGNSKRVLETVKNNVIPAFVLALFSFIIAIYSGLRHWFAKTSAKRDRISHCLVISLALLSIGVGAVAFGNAFKITEALSSDLEQYPLNIFLHTPAAAVIATETNQVAPTYLVDSDSSTVSTSDPDQVAGYSDFSKMWIEDFGGELQDVQLGAFSWGPEAAFFFTAAGFGVFFWLSICWCGSLYFVCKKKRFSRKH